jgi:hypothetical protein
MYISTWLAPWMRAALTGARYSRDRLLRLSGWLTAFGHIFDSRLTSS